MNVMTDKDQLVCDLAKVLSKFGRNLRLEPIKTGKVTKGKKVKGKRGLETRRTGTRLETYSTLEKMYGLIIKDKRFGCERGERRIPKVEKETISSHTEAIRKAIRLSFRVAFPDDHRSWRQRALVWSVVLSAIWRDKKSTGLVLSQILRRGGIEECYRRNAPKTKS